MNLLNCGNFSLKKLRSRSVPPNDSLTFAERICARHKGDKSNRDKGDVKVANGECLLDISHCRAI